MAPPALGVAAAKAGGGNACPSVLSSLEDVDCTILRVHSGAAPLRTSTLCAATGVPRSWPSGSSRAKTSVLPSLSLPEAEPSGDASRSDSAVDAHASSSGRGNVEAIRTAREQARVTAQDNGARRMLHHNGRSTCRRDRRRLARTAVAWYHSHNGHGVSYRGATTGVAMW